MRINAGVLERLITDLVLLAVCLFHVNIYNIYIYVPFLKALKVCVKINLLIKVYIFLFMLCSFKHPFLVCVCVCVGNSQYGQQQEAYQQGPPQPQGYPAQQQYPAQQGYPGQQQGYGEFHSTVPPSDTSKEL